MPSTITTLSRPKVTGGVASDAPGPLRLRRRGGGLLSARRRCVQPGSPLVGLCVVGKDASDRDGGDVSDDAPSGLVKRNF